MSKSPPSKLDAYAEQLDEWFAANMTYAEVQAQLKLGHGGLRPCDVSISRLAAWWSRRQQQALEQRLFATIASGARMSRELDVEFKRNPAPGIEQLIALTRSLIMSLQVQGTANPKLLELANSMQGTVLSYLHGKTKAQIEMRKIELSESKYRDQVAESKRVIAAELNRAKSMGGVRAETVEAIERELKLF